MWDAGRAAGAGGRGRARAPMRVEEAGGGATAMARVGTREGGQAGRRREGQSSAALSRRCRDSGRRAGRPPARGAVHRRGAVRTREGGRLAAARGAERRCAVAASRDTGAVAAASGVGATAHARVTGSPGGG
uniref:Uncharacterized protein n=1 Tax=Oryza sativa subsp. japonica TaxID=39947 RepID=Q84ZR0_ORYSJ|nr:hypothetical protein [Oryza sativa Japonica Group]BAD30430.1 hypothetical protein [Oryza sativa Japonica Group]